MASYQPQQKNGDLRPWIIGIAGLVAAGVGLGIAYRNNIVETALISFAESQGLGQMSLEVEQVSLSTLKLASVDVANGAVTATSLEITYSLSSLRNGEVDRIIVDGLAIQGDWTEQGVSFGPLERLIAEQMAQPREPDTETGVFPFNQLKVLDGLLSLTHPDRLITVKTDLKFDSAETGLSFSATSAIDGPNLEASLNLVGEVTEGDWPNAAIGGTALLQANGFHVPGVTTPLSAEASLALGLKEGKLTFGADQDINLTGSWPQFLAQSEDERDQTFDLVLRSQSPGAPLFELTIEDEQIRTNLDFEMLAVTPFGRGSASIYGQTTFGQDWRPLAFAFDRLTIQTDKVKTPFGALTSKVSANGLSGPSSDMAAPVFIEGRLINGAVAEIAFKEANLKAQATVSLDGRSLQAKLDRVSGQVRGGEYASLLDAKQPITFATLGQSQSNQTVTFDFEQAAKVLFDVAIQVTAPDVSIIQENSLLFLSAIVPELATKGTWDSSDQSLQFDAELKNAELRSEFGNISGITAEISGDSTDLSGPVSVQLEMPGPPTSKPFATIRSDISIMDNNIYYQGFIETYSEKKLGNFDLTYSLEKQTGAFAAQVGPVEFGGTGLNPSDLRALALPFTPTSGQFAAQVDIPIGPGSTEQQGGSAYVKDLELEGASYAIKLMNAAIEMESVWPPQTKGLQKLAIGLLQAGVPVTDVLATFDLNSLEEIHINEVSMIFAEGRLQGGPFSIGLDGQTTTAELTVDNVSLPVLAELSTLEGLKASGDLSGTIPMRLSTREVLIDQGKLSTQEPGYIRYQPGQAVGALGTTQAGQGGMGLAMQALQDFQYDSITVTVSGSILEELEASLAIKGRNPALYNGYPIDFNLNLSGELANVIQGSLAGYRVPETIKRQLLAFPPNQ